MGRVEDLEGLLDAARERARLNAISAKHHAERVETELSNMRRERLLPDEKTLEKVSLYEAHLSRLMFKLVQRLEVLQVRKSAGSLPWHGWTWTGGRPIESGSLPLTFEANPPC